MATIPEVVNNLSQLELILKNAGGLPGEKPLATIGTTGGELTGTIIGYSVTPEKGSMAGTAHEYREAVLYMNTGDGKAQVFIPLAQVAYIRFRI